MDLNKSVCDTCEMVKTCDIFKHYVTDKPKETKISAMPEKAE